MTLGSDGDLYGMTPYATSAGYGTAFKVDPAGNFTLLTSFVNASNSPGNPVAGLIQAPDGNFYGTSEYGGANFCGSVFKMTPRGEITIIHSFDNTDGETPESTLVLGNDGDLYGTTYSGGNQNNGTIFKISLTGNFATLHFFGFSADGTYGGGGMSGGGLLLGSDGNFYGMTPIGGLNDTGTVYQITSTGTFTVLHSFGVSFNNTDGQNPYNNTLVEGRDGALYGLTPLGGLHGTDGTLFRLVVPSLSRFIRFDFNNDGRADLIWYNTKSGGISVWNMNDQTVLQYGAPFTSIAPSSGWVPVAAPDTNGDGYPDLLWWNSTSGDLTLYTLQNTTVEAKNNNFAQIKNTNWKPVAVADNSGGAWTMVLQNKASGDIARWLMNGDKVVNVGPVFASLGAHSPWQVVGAPADLDGDGHSDLLFWNSSTGEVSSWKCDLAKSQVLAYNGDFAQVSDTSWHLVGSEDTNGDGHPDLIWWNANSGAESRWLLDGTTVEQYGAGDTQITDTTWQPTAIR